MFYAFSSGIGVGEISGPAVAAIFRDNPYDSIVLFYVLIIVVYGDSVL